MHTPPKMKIGQPYTVFATLHRTTIHRDGKRAKYWRETPKGWKVAFFIGVRTISNGYTYYENDIGYVYKSTEHFKAFLFVTNEHTKPFFALPSQCKPIIKDNVKCRPLQKP